MKMETVVEQRKVAVHLLRAGWNVADVAEHLDRTPQWVRKWRRRYEREGWQGIQGHSHAPRRHGTRTSRAVRRAIAQARSELEAEAVRGTGLKYIGATSVRTRLKMRGVFPLPGIATIERVLRESGMTRPRSRQSRQSITYPHLKPARPHELCQVDIAPHYLTGGGRVSCFNGLDVVSRYPAGQAYTRRRSQEAAEFLIHVWQEIGIPRYTQMDNEACFSGGFTHPHVLGKVVRLALTVGTEPVFSPVRHPESNGFVERFHQDYNRHVWEDTYLENYEAVRQQTDHFFPLYRHGHHHSALNGQSPHEVHHRIPPRRLDKTFTLSKAKYPLREGRIHFIRRIQDGDTVSVLNVGWDVPDPDPQQGVWVTVELRLSGATLSIYDAAPDVTERACLVSHPFPLSEEVFPLEADETATLRVTDSTRKDAEVVELADEPVIVLPRIRHEPLWLFPLPSLTDRWTEIGSSLLFPTLNYSTQFAHRSGETIY